ncbi:MAG: F0F1 ATP synthase subunit alpha [Alphaproteobacteria bacterium]|nr:F0F1 ATP synthase subunit alpha [Alphaproteobacteria bacterium]
MTRLVIAREVGRTVSVAGGIVVASGLSRVGLGEMVRVGAVEGMVMRITAAAVQIALFGDESLVAAGDKIVRLNVQMSVPVGDKLLGRVVDALGMPIDDEGKIPSKLRMPIEREAPPIISRRPVNVPLSTGTKIIDAMIPIGRGQRELVIGDRQSGKTTIAIDAVIANRDNGVISVLCLIGAKMSEVQRIRGRLASAKALDNVVIVAAASEKSAAEAYVAPYTATAIAEYFAGQGKDVLIVYDNLTLHANAYRQISLSLERAPGREAYPGDIFWAHSRLLERAGNFKSGGSITAMPIIETQAGNLASYIPTNVISITDGQIVLSSALFSKGQLPAIDAGLSVSRIGSKAQIKTLAKAAGNMKSAYASFLDLEDFTKFGSELDEKSEQILARGRATRELLKQNYGEPVEGAALAVMLVALEAGLFDRIKIEKVLPFAAKIVAAVKKSASALWKKIASGVALSNPEMEQLKKVMRNAKP